MMDPPAQLLPFGGPWVVLLRTARAASRSRVSWRECLAQTFEVGNKSAGIVATGMAFFGSVMVIIAESQARKLTGNVSVVGPFYFELLIREFGPAMTSLLVAARIGASYSAELGWMKVSEQLDALRMSAADPHLELVAPRVVASVVALPLLGVLGIAAASLAAVVTATGALGIDGSSFVDARFVDRADVLSALFKMAASGLFIPLAAAWRGFQATGGSSGVGLTTTHGVVTACLGCLTIDFFVAAAMQLLRV